MSLADYLLIAPFALAHLALAFTLPLAALAISTQLLRPALATALAAVFALAAVLALACNSDRDELAIAIGVRRALLQSREAAQGCAAMPAAC